MEAIRNRAEGLHQTSMDLSASKMLRGIESNLQRAMMRRIV